jgi:hypothetical protein
MRIYLLEKTESSGKTMIHRVEALNDQAIFEIAENVLVTTSGLVKVDIYPYLGTVNRVSSIQRTLYDSSNESDGKTQ